MMRLARRKPMMVEGTEVISPQAWEAGRYDDSRNVLGTVSNGEAYGTFHI